jgi:Ca2+-binding RTX toxin-like protein
MNGEDGENYFYSEVEESDSTGMGSSGIEGSVEVVLDSGDHQSTGGSPVPATSTTLTEARDARGNITISGTSGNDDISVTAHYDSRKRQDGVTVTSGGTTLNYLGNDANRITLNGGDGDDRIQIDSRLRNNFTLQGGSGNDSLIGGSGHDTMDGGDGRDYIDGGRGDDLLSGGAGNDILYGGYGNDTVSGGDGRDFVEGGRGNDNLSGGAGNDVVSGGRGNDNVDGGDSNDRVYAGEGRDNVTGGSGQDFVYADTTDIANGGGDAGDSVRTDMRFNATLGHSVRNASGNSQAFNDRIEQDMDLLRYSPTGQQMLETMDSSGQTLEMRESHSPDGSSADVMGSGGSPFMNPATGAAGTRRDAYIEYNVEHNEYYPPGNTTARTDDDWKDVMPIEELYHEMSHTQDYMTGTLSPGQYGVAPYSGTDARDTGMNNRERDAVGLPIDHDGNPATPEQTVNRPELTENGLRTEFGSQLRPTYQDS